MQSISALLAFLSKGEYDDDESSALKEFEGEMGGGPDMPFDDFDPDASIGNAPPGDAQPKLSQVGTGGQAGAAASIQTTSAGPAGKMTDPTEPQGHDRLYLSEIPGGKPPEGYKGKTFTGRQGSSFIDARLLTPKDKEDLHAKDDNKDTSFGGVIINEKGQILLRKPKNHFGGYEWSFAKGGAKEGDNPHDAALREVLEETGLKCEIAGEIPGHFQSDVNNKYFLMKVVGGDIKDFETDETSDAQWFSPEEAESNIKLTGAKNPRGMKRDLAVLQGAFHEHKSNKEHDDDLSSMMNAVDNDEAHNYNLQDHIEECQASYFKTGKLPQSMIDPNHPDYEIHQSLRSDIMDRLINPGNTSATIESFINDLYSSDDMKKKYGEMDWAAANALDVSSPHGSTMSLLRRRVAQRWVNSTNFPEGNAITEILAETLNNPVPFSGSTIPVDIDIQGNRQFRSRANRLQLATAYENWQADETQSKVKLDSGEEVDFSIGGWELAGLRAKSVLSRSETFDKSVDRAFSSWGKHVPKLPGEKTQKAAGERMFRDYVKMHRGLNVQLLDMAYPDVDNIVLWRATTAIAEVQSGLTPEGTQHIQPTDLKNRGFSGNPEDETVENLYESYISSRPLSGWSIHPINFQSGYHLAAEIPKEDVFMSSMDMQGGGGAAGEEGGYNTSEREWMVHNNPNLRAKIMHHRGKNGLIARSQDWEHLPNMNGIGIPGMFHGKKGIGLTATDPKTGKEHTWNVGVDDPDTDWATKYGKTEKVGGMTGTAPGGIIEDEHGDQWYVKHGREDQHVAESLANDLYREAGIMVPETKLINYQGGVAHASKIVPGPTVDSSGDSLVGDHDVTEGYLVDALLGNHDFIGVGPENAYGNIVSSSDGRKYRIDNGGALYMKGSGGEKEFGGAEDHKVPLPELAGFKDPSKNPRAAKVLGEMSQENMQDAFTKLAKLNNTTIANMVYKSGIPPHRMEEVTKSLVSRRNNIVQWLVDNNHLNTYNTPATFKSVEETYGLRKESVIYEDNPVGAPVTDLPINEALEILKKHPLLFAESNLTGNDENDS